LADQAAGNEKQAVENIALVLARAEREGYVRLFIDEGAPMAALLYEVATRTTTDVRGYADRLLAAYYQEQSERPITPAKTLQGNSLIQPLSERELEVLRLIAAGYSNKKVADQLVVAVGTVKRHTANIFNKVGAENRTEAVAKARELGIL
jgi:LuxR family maltose regulon positive regulatory protein